MTPIVHFQDALDYAVQALVEEGFCQEDPVIILRDTKGCIRLFVNADSDWEKPRIDRVRTKIGELGGFGTSPEQAVLYPKDFFDPSRVLQDAVLMQDPAWASPVQIVDRQIIGQDWLNPIMGPSAGPPRLVFFGLKGGVGRSTAMALLAFSLAREGRRVLLVDLDLESPGLSGLMLPPDDLPDFGVVDYLVEDAVGQGDDVIRRIVAASPMATQTTGEIRVVSAMGIGERDYLAKLSRAYADVPGVEGPISFASRLRGLLDRLAIQERPDVILVDSRAGLHDLAAVCTVGLADNVLLFATDSPQSWQGYRLLFQHWQRHPRILKSIRDRLKMVQALFPEADQAARSANFLQNAYSVFADTLYESILPGEEDLDAFHFSKTDEAAPHYPLRINWDNRFQEFSPLLLASGAMTEDQILATYGAFIKGARGLVGLTGELA